MNLHNNSFQNQIKAEMIASYEEFLDELVNEIDLNHPFLDEYFSEILTRELAENSDLKVYSEKKFFWLNLLEGLIFLVGLCEEYEESESDSEKAEVEDEIFFFWDSSEHSQVFLDYLNEGLSIWEATQEMIPILENQIIAFYYVQILGEYSTEKNILYSIIPEMGESQLTLYLGEDHKEVSYNGKAYNTFPTLVIHQVDSDSVTIEKKSFPAKVNDNYRIEKYNLNILPNCKLGIEKLSKFKEDIVKALDIIQEHSPNCFQAFQNFSKVIVPVNEKNIVSYSMQSLPGYSSINMFDRDFVDLLDDLIHENGHHVLNALLNSQQLINEDDDKIYYSPWRRALRPIRGIYHAVFTFYWALELFSDLSHNKDQLALSKDQLDKIAFRVVEEYLMLSYCEKDLQHAFENDKVTHEGKELIDSIIKLVKEKSPEASNARSYLSDNNSELISSIIELESTLKEKDQNYRN